MDIDADRLTETLAGRLAAIVPDGFHVRATDGMLWYFSDGGRFPGQLNNYQAHRSGTYVRDNFEAYAEDLGDSDSVVYVVECALDNLQDLIDEATHDPWPGTVRPPRPYAQIRGEMLHLWYGGPEITSPVVLACEPIPLAQIQRSP